MTTRHTCWSEPSAAPRGSSTSIPCVSRSSTTAESRRPGRWPTAVATPPTRQGAVRRCACTPTWHWESRAVGPPGRSCRRATSVLCLVLGGKTSLPSTRPNARIDRTDRFWHNRLARALDHQWAHPIQRSVAIKGMTYMPTGVDRGVDNPLPETRRRAELGLPPHVDAGHHVHAAGRSLNPDWKPRSSCERRRPRAERGRWTADHVRHGRRRGDVDHLSGCRRPPCANRNGVPDQRQNDVYGPVTGPPGTSKPTLARRLWPIVQSQAACASRCGASPTRHWEAWRPQHYVSPKAMCWVADRFREVGHIRRHRARRHVARPQTRSAEILERG
jgi:hypothetical protein